MWPNAVAAVVCLLCGVCVVFILFSFAIEDEIFCYYICYSPFYNVSISCLPACTFRRFYYISWHNCSTTSRWSSSSLTCLVFLFEFLQLCFDINPDFFSFKCFWSSIIFHSQLTPLICWENIVLLLSFFRRQYEPILSKEIGSSIFRMYYFLLCLLASSRSPSLPLW